MQPRSVSTYLLINVSHTESISSLQSSKSATRSIFLTVAPFSEVPAWWSVFVSSHFPNGFVSFRFFSCQQVFLFLSSMVWSPVALILLNTYSEFLKFDKRDMMESFSVSLLTLIFSGRVLLVSALPKGTIDSGIVSKPITLRNDGLKFSSFFSWISGSTSCTPWIIRFCARRFLSASHELSGSVRVVSFRLPVLPELSGSVRVVSFRLPELAGRFYFGATIFSGLLKNSRECYWITRP